MLTTTERLPEAKTETKVHFKIVGSDCNFAHNFLVWTRVLIILIAFDSWRKKLDFTCKIKWKMKKKRCQKWRWKNATHRNSIDMTFKFDKYVAGYLCTHSSQKLFLYEQFLYFNLIFSGHGWLFSFSLLKA